MGDMKPTGQSDPWNFVVRWMSSRFFNMHCFADIHLSLQTRLPRGVTVAVSSVPKTSFQEKYTELPHKESEQKQYRSVLPSKAHVFTMRFRYALGRNFRVRGNKLTGNRNERSSLQDGLKITWTKIQCMYLSVPTLAYLCTYLNLGRMDLLRGLCLGPRCRYHRSPKILNCVSR